MGERAKRPFRGPLEALLPELARCIRYENEAYDPLPILFSVIRPSSRPVSDGRTRLMIRPDPILRDPSWLARNIGQWDEAYDSSRSILCDLDLLCLLLLDVKYSSACCYYDISFHSSRLVV